MRKWYLLGIAAIMVLAATLIAGISYGNYVETGLETYNPQNQLLTGVYTRITFAYDDGTNQFVTDYRYTYARHWTYKAWWCAPCYANILDSKDSTSPNYLYARTNWTQGSWNVNINGYNEVAVSTTDQKNKLFVDIHVYANGNAKIDTGKFASFIPVLIRIIARW